MIRIVLVLAGTFIGIFLIANATGQNYDIVFETSTVVGETFPRKIVTGQNSFILKSMPKRIVSCTFFADEIILVLVDPARVQAVTFMADQENYCSFVDAAKRVPHRVRSVSNLEHIISLRPDLVIVDPYNTPEAVMLLSSLKIPVFKIDYPKSVADVERNILTLGKILGKEAKAGQLVNEIRAVKTGVKKQKAKPRVLYLLGNTVPTTETLLHDIIQLAGGVNVTAEWGRSKFVQISLEKLLELEPDVIFTAYRSELLKHPAASMLKAVKHKQVFVISPKYYESGSHVVVNAIKEMARYIRRVK